jgi:plasmid stabilization system protein ParE
VFLHSQNPSAARRAAQAILQHFVSLGTAPEIGRQIEGSALRELLINFGASGYAALCRCDSDTIYSLAFRHQREAGY